MSPPLPPTAAPPGRRAPPSETLICQNRKAKHTYAVSDLVEAGLVLQGTEVKACRAGHAHLQEAYVQVVRGEALLVGAYIGEYAGGNQFNHPTDRSRRLLLHRAQIDKLSVAVAQKGYTVVPLRLYFKGGRVKLSIGLGRGKTQVDRREDLKKRDSQRDMERALRSRRR